jgi:GH25 family lysozyme M1 (1,4-beta-N-acetylmuramidase)
MVYFNLDLAKRMFDLQAIQAAGYDFWLALYADGLGYAHRVRMWQYTSNGSVAGIKGRVDLNLYFP